MKKGLRTGVVLLTAFATLTMILAACGVHNTSTATGPTVHMGNANFLQNSITIQKGQSVTLIDDVQVEHVITNGTWKNGQVQTPKENNAPTYNHTFNGNDSDTFGPFNVSGTFHYYCTIHPGMNLTVIVK